MKVAQHIANCRPVFAGHKLASHMPFFDGSTLVFCQAGPPLEKTLENKGTIWKVMRQNPVLAERLRNLPKVQHIRYRAWKLAFCNWSDKIIHPITSGLPENYIECSPAFYWEGDTIHLSFIGGTPTAGGWGYRLYTTSGPDLAHLEPAKPLPIRSVYFGFVGPHHVCSGIKNSIRLTEKATDRTFRLRIDFVCIRRVSFVADSPAQLLITGLDKERCYRTILYDLASANTSEISAEGPVYKSSLYRQHLLYSRLSREGFEDREVYHGDYKLLPSPIHVTLE